MNKDNVTINALTEALAEAALDVTDERRVAFLERQRKRGKLSARQRVAMLLDEGSFRETGVLALADDGSTSRQDAPGDGVILGTGRIDGRPVGIGASDFTALGGSSGVVGGLKGSRIMRFCVEHGLPMIRLADGGGHRIQEGLSSRHFARGNRAFQDYIAASGWVPMVCALLGAGFAGPANFAALSDFVVGVRGIGTLGVAGPPLVKAALGLDISKEELGDLDMQASRNGIVDLVVDTEKEALASIRRFLSYFPSNAAASLPIGDQSDPPGRRSEELLDIVPANLRLAYDVRKVINLIADKDSCFELRPTHARNLVTSLGRLHGKPVGIIANQPLFLAGAIDSAAAEKGAHFVSMCDAFGLPLVYLVDTPGFLVGPAAEKEALARRSAKLIFELGRATVPHATVLIRKGYGLGYIAMNGGRSFDPDAVLAWPTAEISAMSVEGGVDVAFKTDYEAADDPAQRRAELISHYKGQTRWEAAAEGYGIDDVIDPRDTRLRLIEAFALCQPRRPRSMPPKYHPITPI